MDGDTIWQSNHSPFSISLSLSEQLPTDLNGSVERTSYPSVLAVVCLFAPRQDD